LVSCGVKEWDKGNGERDKGKGTIKVKFSPFFDDIYIRSHFMIRVGALPPQKPARKVSFRVKIIKIKPSTWWDSESCVEVIQKALRANGIDTENNLLYRGVALERKKMFLKNGTDFHPPNTVMALDKLYNQKTEIDGALHYAFRHRKPMVAVYKELDPADSYDVYELDANHPTKGLLALIEL
jgi:hypothetical protein